MSNTNRTARIARASAKAQGEVAKAGRAPRAPATPAKVETPATPAPVAVGGRFALDAGDNYKAHPRTMRTENGKLIPGVAAPSKRAQLADTKVGKSMGVNRKYKLGSKPNEAREGTYRHYMLSVIMAHTSRHDAIVAYAKRPWPDNRPLDAHHCFGWAVKQGYIVWVD